MMGGGGAIEDIATIISPLGKWVGTWVTGGEKDNVLGKVTALETSVGLVNTAKSAEWRIYSLDLHDKVIDMLETLGSAVSEAGSTERPFGEAQKRQINAYMKKLQDAKEAIRASPCFCAGPL